MPCGAAWIQAKITASVLICRIKPILIYKARHGYDTITQHCVACSAIGVIKRFIKNGNLESRFNAVSGSISTNTDNSIGSILTSFMEAARIPVRRLNPQINESIPQINPALFFCYFSKECGKKQWAASAARAVVSDRRLAGKC